MQRGSVPIDGSIQNDLRERIADAVDGSRSTLVADAAALFPFSGTEHLEPEYCTRLGDVVVRLLRLAVHDRGVDRQDGTVADLERIAGERSLAATRLFTFVYFVERCALDELALNDSIGATSESWPLVAQIVHRASFDLLAAYAERAGTAPTEQAIVDKLTTLHTRPLFDAALGKELERAGRFGDPLSLILFDVDRLSAINQQHGYGVGDRVLERIGILIRQYFRQHDWVARHADDAMAVLLPRTGGDQAAALAERVRATVEERLGFVDHRSNETVPVTVSAAVVNLEVAAGQAIDGERLVADTELAVARAKHQGRNRVVRVDGYPGTAPGPLTPR